MGNEASNKAKSNEKSKTSSESPPKSDKDKDDVKQAESNSQVSSGKPQGKQLKKAKKKKTPIELGTVNWNLAKDYDKVINESRKTNKAIFLLFQEIPGCSTCKNYGKFVLSNKEIVNLIETNFLPIAIYNNKMIGKDSTILNKFNEPSWNNPVVRIIDSNEKDIIPRLNGPYTIEAVHQYINKALKKIEQ